MTDNNRTSKQELYEIARTMECNGGWHIAALKVRAAADEIERLRPVAQSWESYEAAQECKAQMRQDETTGDNALLCENCDSEEPLKAAICLGCWNKLAQEVIELRKQIRPAVEPTRCQCGSPLETVQICRHCGFDGVPAVKASACPCVQYCADSQQAARHLGCKGFPNHPTYDR